MTEQRRSRLDSFPPGLRDFFLFGETFEEGGTRRRRVPPPERGGFPQPAPPIFPLPVPPTTQPPTPPVRFPTGPAANDPVFSRAGVLLRSGNILVGVAIILDQLIRKTQDLRIEQEQAEREAIFKLETRRRALRREPIEIEVPEPRPDPEPFDPSQIPSIPQLPSQVPATSPIEIPGVQIPAPEPVAPGRIETPGPSVPTAPRPATVPVPVPASVPGIGSEPGVFTPSAPAATPIGSPSPVPGLFPNVFTVGRPSQLTVGDPLTGVGTSPVPSLTTPQTFVEVLEFPQPVPQTQPARRCKPCPEEPPPEVRDACFKGLYREGPLTDQVDFTEWAEIDCLTGEEL